MNEDGADRPGVVAVRGAVSSAVARRVIRIEACGVTVTDEISSSSESMCSYPGNMEFSPSLSTGLPSPEAAAAAAVAVLREVLREGE